MAVAAYIGTREAVLIGFSLSMLLWAIRYNLNPKEMTIIKNADTPDSGYIVEIGYNPLFSDQENRTLGLLKKQRLDTLKSYYSKIR